MTIACARSMCLIPSFVGKKWTFEFGESSRKLCLMMRSRTRTNERKVVQLSYFVLGCVISMLIFSNRVLSPIFISTTLQSGKFLNLAHYVPYDVKLWLMAHSQSFLANQKARNAIVGAENLLIIFINRSMLVCSYEQALEKSHCTLASKAQWCDHKWFFRCTA